MNQRIKISENFFLDEYVPKELHDKIIADTTDGNYAKTLAIYQDERIPVLMQWIRNTVGISVAGNDWWDGGDLDERGVRMPNATTGAPNSKHKYKLESGVITRRSCAQDCQIGKQNGKKMFDWAWTNRVALHGLGVRCIEHYSITPGWLHMDMRPLMDKQSIIIVDKKDIITTWKIK